MGCEVSYVCWVELSSPARVGGTLCGGVSSGPSDWLTLDDRSEKIRPLTDRKGLVQDEFRHKRASCMGRSERLDG
jgi:hypothetical protein